MIQIARSLAVAIFYFVIACVVEEAANHMVKKLKKKYSEQRS